MGHNRGLMVSRLLCGGLWLFQSLRYTYGLRPVFMVLRPDSTFQPPWLNNIDMPRVGLRRLDVILQDGGRGKRGYAPRIPASKGERNAQCQ